ncbi:MAG: hypothetical protein ACI398_09490 [Clostridium sp.]
MKKLLSIMSTLIIGVSLCPVSANAASDPIYHIGWSTDFTRETGVSVLGRYEQGYIYHLKEGQTIDAYMNSDDFDAFLILDNDDKGETVYADDDSGEGTYAHLVYTAPKEADYCLRLTQCKKATGTYGISISIYDK